MHQPAVSDWLPRRRSLPLLTGSPHTLESPPTTWFLPSVLVFYWLLLLYLPVKCWHTRVSPCLLVSLLSLDSHLPVHDSPDRWIWNFSPLDLSFELEINISNCPLDISAWMSQGTINSPCPSFISYLSPENAVSLSQWKACPPKLVCKSEIWQFPLAVSLFLSSPSKTPSVTKSSWLFYIFFLISDL